LCSTEGDVAWLYKRQPLGAPSFTPSHPHPNHLPPTLPHSPHHTNPHSPENLHTLTPHCAEFLIHAADAKGLQLGIDERLIRTLASFNLPLPITYAGGGRNVSDLDRVRELSGGKVDLTLGSCLDVFGGGGCTFAECVEWNRG